ncbi:MAG TPA: DUF418 domain-containing protein, partial [Candidatus Limnocylindrales bacterium]|nr:DUF418 domain-containing protein [Candidatus Limnocylindrales bacterium]
LISASLLLAVAMSAIALDAPDPGRDIYLYGSYWDVVQYRLAVETPAVLVNTIFMVPRILGLFLLGLYAGRSGIFKNSDAHLPFIRKAWRIGGLVGVGLSLLHLGLQLNLISLTATPMINIMSAVVLREISTPFLSLFYVSSIMLLWHAHKLRRLSSGLAALGRMALTNYLVQCLVCSILFYGYGIGLMGSISMPSILLLTLAIYGIQVIYSTWWLNRYTHGPAEWVWRRLTYGRVLSADNTPTAYIK